MKPFIEVKNVWQEYGDQVVLERLNLTVNEGEFCTLVGASGCGKSTFLRLLLGQERPSKGEILLAGQPLPGEPVIGYLTKTRGLSMHRANCAALISVAMYWPSGRMMARLMTMQPDPVTIAGMEFRVITLDTRMVTEPNVGVMSSELRLFLNDQIGYPIEGRTATTANGVENVSASDPVEITCPASPASRAMRRGPVAGRGNRRKRCVA